MSSAPARIPPGDRGLTLWPRILTLWRKVFGGGGGPRGMRDDPRERALTLALTALLLLPLALAPALSQQTTYNCVLVPKTVSEEGKVSFAREGNDQLETCEGELAGPEFSGETETVKLALADTGELSDGFVIRITVEVRHVRFLAARYFVGYGPAGGGIFSSVDDVIREGERKVVTFEHYVSYGELDDLVVVVSSIAFRDTPAVLNYSVRASAEPRRDANVVSLVSGDGSRTTLSNPDWGDVPNDYRLIGEGGPGYLAGRTLIPGSTLELSGWLSSRQADRAKSTYMFSKDLTDVYALSVKPVPQARVRVSVTPDDPSSKLSVALRARDGFPINSTTGPQGGAAVVEMVYTDRSRDDRIFVEIQLVESRTFLTRYSMRVEVIEPPPPPELPPQVTVPIPEAQVRSIVIGLTLVILSAVVVSAIIGRRKRSREYYWNY